MEDPLVKQLWCSVLFALALLPAAHAQRYNGHGYAYYSIDAPHPGNFGDLMSAGGGGEAFLWKGLTVGGEVGYLFPRASTSEGIGLLSLDGGWQFVNRDHPGKVVPFVTGGYTLAFRSGVASLLNVGGGVAWWFTRRLALRTEVRTYVYTSNGGAFDTSIRFGIQFR